MHHVITILYMFVLSINDTDLCIIFNISINTAEYFPCPYQVREQTMFP